MPDGLLLVRAHPHQQQGAQPGVGDLGVGEGLQGLGEGLVVEFAAVGGGEGEPAAVHAEAEFPGEVGARRGAGGGGQLVVPGERRPVELLALGGGVVALAATVLVVDPVVVETPAQHPDVGGGGAGAEDGEQPAADRPQPFQPGVAEVAAQVGEVLAQSRVVQQGALGGGEVVGPVEAEDVREVLVAVDHFGGPGAEQQQPAGGGEVLRQAGPGGGEPPGAGEQ